MDWKERLKEILMEARRQPFKRTPRRRGSGEAAGRTAAKNDYIRNYIVNNTPKERGHSALRGPGPDAKPAGWTLRNQDEYEKGKTEKNQQDAIDGMRAAAERKQKQPPTEVAVAQRKERSAARKTTHPQAIANIRRQQKP